MTGITAQYGFMYQRKIFLYTLLSKMKSGAVHSFEYLDDVSFEACDRYFFTINKDIDERELMQAKSGTVKKQQLLRVLTNWLILDFPVNRFTLILENDIDYEINSSLGSEIIEQMVKNKDQQATAIFKKAYLKYYKKDKLNQKLFDIELKNILSKFQKHVISIDELDTECRSKYVSDYCTDIVVANIAKDVRYAGFETELNLKIDEAIKEKKPYKITYSEFNNINADMVMKFSDNSYEPDFLVFKDNKKELVENIIKSKEKYVDELKLVFVNSSTLIINNIFYKLFYEDMRRFFISHKKNEVLNLEDQANSNYDEAIYEVGISGDITPYKLYNSTVGRSLNSSYMKGLNVQTLTKGCYVYLSDENNESKYKISWCIK